MVGQECNPPVNPHRVREVPVQFRNQAFELAAAVTVDPDPAGRAAAVALPPCLLPGDHGSHQHRTLIADRRAVDYGTDGAVRQQTGSRPVHGNLVGPGQAPILMSGGGDGQDVSGCSESLDPRIGGAPEGEAAETSAFDVGRHHLGRVALNNRPGQPGSVRREAGVGGGQLQGRDAPGTAAVDRREPHIVFRHKGHQALMEVWISQIGKMAHGSDPSGPLPQGRGQGASSHTCQSFHAESS